MFHIFLNPFLWNVLGQIEYNTKKISKLFCGNAKFAVYTIFVIIFTLGLTRNYSFKVVVDNSPYLEWNENICKILGLIFYAAGMTLVVTSSWRLGIIGTYLGDYVKYYLFYFNF